MGRRVPLPASLLLSLSPALTCTSGTGSPPRGPPGAPPSLFSPALALLGLGSQYSHRPYGLRYGYARLSGAGGGGGSGSRLAALGGHRWCSFGEDGPREGEEGVVVDGPSWMGETCEGRQCCRYVYGLR